MVKRARNLLIALSFLMVSFWGGLVWAQHAHETVAHMQPMLTSGFATRGGEGQPVYRVTTRADSGPGSLREAVSRGQRRVIFDVSGEIRLASDIYVKGAFVTIDGLTAPDPGVTIRGHGFILHGDQGTHDVIIRGLRIRGSQGCDTCADTGAGINVSRNAYNVLVEYVSITGAQDQAFGTGKGAHDVEVRWSLLAESRSVTGKNLPVLIGTSSYRVSLHHNLLMKGYERLPQAKWSDGGVMATGLQLDFRNNLIWDWQYAGSQIWKGTRANLINNYYFDPNADASGQRRAIYFCRAGLAAPQCDGSNRALFARAHITGNVSGAGASVSRYLNSLGNEANPMPAPSLPVEDACTSAKRVLAQAGVRPLDVIDRAYVAQVKLPGCEVPTTLQACVSPPAPFEQTVEVITEGPDGRITTRLPAVGCEAPLLPSPE